MRQNLNFIKNQGDLVLILSGDHLYRMDYRKFVEFHVRSGADLTISVTPVSADQVHEFGVMKVGHGGVITEFKEKPKDPAAKSIRLPLMSTERTWLRVLRSCDSMNSSYSTSVPER